MAEYQAEGGALQDDQGRPILDPAKLSSVLTFFHQGVESGVMPADLLIQLTDDDQTWDAFDDRKAQILVGWSSVALRRIRDGVGIDPIPTRDGQPSALATGWVWSLVGRDEQKRRLAIELAEYLTDSNFLADWSQAAGFLPTRPSSLALWSDEDLRGKLDRIASASHLLPPTDILTILMSPLQQAGINVLTGKENPAAAAQNASSSLTSPLSY